MQKKSFQIFQMEFFSNSTSFLLKKSYIPSNIAPFNYPGTLRVIGPGSGPGPGNGKSQKTGSGPGTPLPSISGYPGNSLPGPTILHIDYLHTKCTRIRWVPGWVRVMANLKKTVLGRVPPFLVFPGTRVIHYPLQHYHFPISF